MEKKLHNEEWTGETLADLIKKMRQDGLVFNEINLEYRKRNKWVYVSATGKESLSISDSYFTKIEEQLKNVHNTIFKDFVNFTQSQCEMTIKVDESGNFDLNNIEMIIHMDIDRTKNADQALRRPLSKFLPFLENITMLEARGYNYEMTVLHCIMHLSEEDFNIVLEDPSIIHPKAKMDWFSMCSILFMKAKEDYTFDQTIPCFNGELVWDNKDVTIKQAIRKAN